MIYVEADDEEYEPDEDHHHELFHEKRVEERLVVGLPALHRVPMPLEGFAGVAERTAVLEPVGNLHPPGPGQGRSPAVQRIGGFE